MFTYYVPAIYRVTRATDAHMPPITPPNTRGTRPLEQKIKTVNVQCNG